MMRSLTHGRLHVPHAAAPPAVLFVHGGFHGAWCWTQAMAALAARGVGAAAVDLRGHGGLAQDASFLNQGVDAMTHDVIEAMQQLPPVFLAGHSLGALIAMQAATQHELRGLILLAPAAPAGIAQAHSLPRFPTTRAIQPPGEERARKWFMAGANTQDLSTYTTRLCPESPKLLNDCFHDGVVIEQEMISCPILCLSGGKDDSPLHPAGQDQAVAARYGAALKVIEPSGHCLMLDDGWEQTAGAIHDWIDTQ